MPYLPLLGDQKAQIVGFLNREHDHGIALRSIARDAIIPGAMGSLELISSDYEWILRVRETIRKSRDTDPELSVVDIEILEIIARANPYKDRDELWTGVIDAIGRSTSHDSKNPTEVFGT